MNRRAVLPLFVLACVAWIAYLVFWSPSCPPEGAADPAPTAAAGSAAPEVTDPAEAAPEETDERPELSNRIRWATASEIDSFGYDVYRGRAEEGPFERLTEDPVPGNGTTDEESRYQWIDDTIEPETAYWYYVESIDLDGTRERFTPIFRAGPKPGPVTDADAPASQDSAESDSAPADSAPAESAGG